MGSDSEVDKSSLKEKKKIASLTPIAKPLAGKRLCKCTLKLVRRAAEHRCLKRGPRRLSKVFDAAIKGKIETSTFKVKHLSFTEAGRSLEVGEPVFFTNVAELSHFWHSPAESFDLP